MRNLRSDSDGRGGYSWSVTFLEYTGDVPALVADSDLTGFSVVISVVEVSFADTLDLKLFCCNIVL